MNQNTLKTIFGLLLVQSVFSACCGGPMSTMSNESNISMSPSSSELLMNSSKQDMNMKNLDLKQIAEKCNSTSKISTDYLKELNDTGSFPDETDKTPMCFMKCYLENVGILGNSSRIDKDRAVDMLWAKSEETIDECEKEMMGDDCEKAYYLARCVMTRSLVENRSSDQSSQS